MRSPRPGAAVSRPCAVLVVTPVNDAPVLTPAGDFPLGPATNRIDYQSVDLPDAYDPDAWGEEAEEKRGGRGFRTLVVLLLVLALLGVLGWVLAHTLR